MNWVGRAATHAHCHIYITRWYFAYICGGGAGILQWFLRA